MKKKLKDEKGYPLNFDFSGFYKDPERLFPLPSSFYNTDPNKYFVTSWGRIYNSETEKYVPRNLIPDSNRYIIVMIKNIYNQDISIVMHQLIAEMFVIYKPIIPHQMICPNHIDAIKWHNEPYNLEWVSLSENIIHADKNNLIERPYGEDNGNASLTDCQYRQICQMTQDGLMPNEINKRMNLSIDITNIAQKIRMGKSELLISQEYDFSNIPRNNYRKFSEDQVRYICQCLQNKPEMKAIDILISMGYDINNIDFSEVKKLKDTISTIKRRICYKEISNNYKF